MATLAELAKGFSEFKAQFAEFQGKFNAVLKFLTWCGATLAALAVAIVGFLYAQGQTLTRLDTSLGDLKDQLKEQSTKLTVSLNAVAQSNREVASAAQRQPADLEKALAGIAAQQATQLEDIKTQIVKRLEPVEGQTLRIAFTSENFRRIEGQGLFLAATLPERIHDETDRATAWFRVQSLDLPREFGTYQASARLVENGTVCQLTIYSAQPEQLKQLLSSTGITGSFLVSLAPSRYSQK